MAAVASSKGRVIAGSFVARVLAGKAASPRYGITSARLPSVAVHAWSEVSGSEHAQKFFFFFFVFRGYIAWFLCFRLIFMDYGALHVVLAVRSLMVVLVSMLKTSKDLPCLMLPHDL